MSPTNYNESLLTQHRAHIHSHTYKVPAQRLCNTLSLGPRSHALEGGEDAGAVGPLGGLLAPALLDELDCSLGYRLGNDGLCAFLNLACVS